MSSGESEILQDMKKKKIIGLLMLLLPVLSFAQASGGQVKKPVKKTQSVTAKPKPSPKKQAKQTATATKISPTTFSNYMKDKSVVVTNNNELELEKMLTMPMGITNCNLLKAPFQMIKDGLSQYYNVEDSFEEWGNGIFVLKRNNETFVKIMYHGIPLYSFFINIINSKNALIQRSITYRFRVPKLNMEIPCRYLDKMVQDFNNLGISINYHKERSDYTFGKQKKGNIEYKIELQDYDNYWQFNICESVYKE